MQRLENESSWDYSDRLKKQQYEIATAFLQKCRSKGLSVREVKGALKIAESFLEGFTTLECGLDLPSDS